MKIKKTIVMVAAITAVLGVGIVFGAAANPGSEADPVVTKSYVDSKLQEINAATGAKYTSVMLTVGQKMIGNEGTEIILRSGEATAIDNGANGVSDISDGKDLRMGNAITANHLLLIPRTDGRGIAASTEAWVMVRGGYKIQ